MISPKGGSFDVPQSVTISDTTPAASIYFTVDGTNPTVNSTVYANPISVGEGTTTVRAMAKADGLAQSPVAFETYTVTTKPGQTKPVAFDPASGEYNNPVAVGLSTTTAPSTICYTIDNSAPTCNAGTCTGTSAQYSAGSPIPIDAPTGGLTQTTVKALACSTGNTNSEITSSTYSFKVAAPTIEPTPGEVAYNTGIAIHTDTAPTPSIAVQIRYTTNGTDPTCTTGTVGAPAGQTANLNITQNTEIRAIACRGNYQASDVRKWNYTVKLTAPTYSTTLPNNGTGATKTDNSGSATGVHFNALAGGTGTGGQLVLPTTGVPVTGLPVGATACYRLGADPACTAAGACDTSDATNPAVPGAAGDLVNFPVTLSTNANNNVRVRYCAPNYTPSDIVQATYSFTVAQVGIRPNLTPVGGATDTNAGYCGPTPTGTCFEPTTTSNFYKFAGGSQTFVLDTRFPGQGTSPTGTASAKIRYSTATGTALPAAPAVTCGQTCPGDATCTEVNPGATVTVPEFTTINAVACRTDYIPAASHTLIYADPNQSVSVIGPTPPASAGPFSNDTVLDFTTVTPQPTTRAPNASETHVCWTTSINNVIEPTCSNVTGACGLPSGALDPLDSYGEYAPCSNVGGATCTPTAAQTAAASQTNATLKKPLVYRTGTIVKAVACRAGVGSGPGKTTPQTYTLKVATPTFSPVAGTPANPTLVGFDTPIDFATVTTGATINYRRSDSAPTASDPSCATGVPNQVTSNFINEFDNECADTIGSACAPAEQVKLIACKTGYLPSDVATGDFKAKLADPTITAAANPAPVAGVRHNEVVVSINNAFFTGLSVAGAHICYTTDNSVPACNGAACTAPGGTVNIINIGDPHPTNINVGNATLPSGTTVKAIACATDYPASGVTSAKFDFAIQPYSVSPAPGAQSGGAKNISFKNTLPIANGTEGSGFTCQGGPTAGASCSTSATCGAGGVCSNDPTVGLVLCYSTDGTDIPADCTETTPPVGGYTPASPQHVFCSNGPQNGANASPGANTFNTANGTWAPPALQGLGTSINQLKSRACKLGFTSTTPRNDQYTFGAYSRAETIDGTNNFSALENRLDESPASVDPGEWGSVDHAFTGDMSDPVTNNNYSFVSWTSTDVYFAFQGDALTASPNEYVEFYVKGGVGGLGGLDGTASGTTNRDQRGGGFPADEFGDTSNRVATNYHFFMRPADGISSAKVRVWNGSAWIDPLVSPGFSVQFGGALGTTNAFVEFRVTRADLGLGAAASRLIFQGLVWDGAGSGDTLYFPATNTDPAPAGANHWAWIDADMSSALFPSARAYIKTN
ncbi:MAG: FN3 associated domain-containing protein [Labilithrix sp.]